MYSCQVAERKSDQYTKLCFISQAQKFIRYYTFKLVVGRKKKDYEN